MRLVPFIAALAACGRFGFTERDAGDAASQGSDAFVPVARANLAFASRAAIPGDFGGSAGADAICQQEAIEAGRSGTFVALVVDSQRPSLDSLVSGSRGWKTADDEWAADLPEDVSAGAWMRPLHLDAKGLPISGAPRVWTGDNGSRCDDWTSAAVLATGDQSYVPQWRRRSDGGLSCAELLHLPCVEVGHVFAFEPKPITHNRVFISAQDWTPNPGGRNDADALCAAEASAAGLSGTYLAVLPVGATPALQRFSGGVAVEYRSVNGSLIGRLGTGITYVLLSASGSPQLATVWSGGNPAAPSPVTCSDWTSTVGTTQVGRSDDSNGFPDGNPVFDRPCIGPNRLFCAEP